MFTLNVLLLSIRHSPRTKADAKFLLHDNEGANESTQGQGQSQSNTRHHFSQDFTPAPRSIVRANCMHSLFLHITRDTDHFSPQEATQLSCNCDHLQTHLCDKRLSVPEIRSREAWSIEIERKQARQWSSTAEVTRIFLMPSVIP